MNGWRNGLAAALLASAAQGGNLAATSGTYAASLGAGAATAAERSAFGQNPAALRPGQAGLRLDVQRPYGLDDVSVADAGIFFDRARAGIACDWRATTITGLYSEHGFRCAPALRLGGSGFPGQLDLGYGISAWRAATAGEGARWTSAQESGAVWRPCGRLAFGAFAEGWPALPGAARQERVIQFGGQACSRDPEAGKGATQIVRLDFRKTYASPWRALASLAIEPHPSLELIVGTSTPPFQLSAGLALAWGGVRVREALRYHRYLGRTWLSGLEYAHRAP